MGNPNWNTEMIRAAPPKKKMMSKKPSTALRARTSRLHHTSAAPVAVVATDEVDLEPPFRDGFQGSRRQNARGGRSLRVAWTLANEIIQALARSYDGFR